jgi:hypothetical protein
LRGQAYIRKELLWNRDMATIPQIRGMLLEEALLYLLRVSGYRIVEYNDSDPTLHDGPSGLEVKGRGGRHQIDAIAEFAVAHPFSHPQRLLVEAKCYAESYPIGIDKIRHAVGVLKDIQECWFSEHDAPPKKRYHYQFAYFSASKYTSQAEQYAYAQDIYLIPLAQSRFIQPVIDAIRQVTPEAFGLARRRGVDINLSDLRRAIRAKIRGVEEPNLFVALAGYHRAVESLERFCATSRRINEALLAMINRQFPVFLVPSPEIRIAELENEYEVRIYWDDEGWYLKDRRDNIDLFSFDLPPSLFDLYADQGVLSASRALALKAELLGEIQAVVTVDERARVVTFRLDLNWLNRLRENLGRAYVRNRFR